MGGVGGKRQHAGGTAAQNQFMKVRFVDREMTLPEQTDSFCIAVDTENMVSDGGEAAAYD
jgi:hypothetical protein